MQKKKLRIAFIHNEKKLGTGAHFINDLMSKRLTEEGTVVRNFYPSHPLIDAPVHLKGFYNILFFYSLLERKSEMLECDLIQGTTYTPLAFLPFNTPIVTHFGSTTWGFLREVPLAKDLENGLRKIWFALKSGGVIRELNAPTRRPLRDVAEMEKIVATRAQAVIATSEIVKKDLLEAGVTPDRLFLVPNAIEDYWFEQAHSAIVEVPSLVFLGRLGSDPFTLKLKGMDRLIDYYMHFKETPKHTIAITPNKALIRWCSDRIPHHSFYANLKKERIPALLSSLAGSVLLITSRYEGFSLSLVEGMSQGLIPIAYPVGIAPEIIRNGENGYLVSSQAEGRRVAAELLTAPRERRTELATAARETVRKFNSHAISKELLAVYRAVLERKEEQRKTPA